MSRNSYGLQSPEQPKPKTAKQTDVEVDAQAAQIEVEIEVDELPDFAVLPAPGVTTKDTRSEFDMKGLAGLSKTADRMERDRETTYTTRSFRENGLDYVGPVKDAPYAPRIDRRFYSPDGSGGFVLKRNAENEVAMQNEDREVALYVAGDPKQRNDAWPAKLDPKLSDFGHTAALVKLDGDSMVALVDAVNALHQALGVDAAREFVRTQPSNTGDPRDLARLYLNTDNLERLVRFVLRASTPFFVARLARGLDDEAVVELNAILDASRNGSSASLTEKQEAERSWKQEHADREAARKRQAEVEAKAAAEIEAEEQRERARKIAERAAQLS